MNAQTLFHSLLNWPAKMNNAARWVFVICLYAIGLVFGWLDPQVRNEFSWHIVWHWLWVWAIATAAITILLALITLAVFAFHPECLTSHCYGDFLYCVLLEAFVVGVLVGLFALIGAMMQMAG